MLIVTVKVVPLWMWARGMELIPFFCSELVVACSVNTVCPEKRDQNVFLQFFLPDSDNSDETR